MKQSDYRVVGLKSCRTIDRIPSNLVPYLVLPVFKQGWFYFDLHDDLDLHKTVRLVASYDNPRVLTTSVAQIPMGGEYI